jgi:hypothetical protein
MLQSVSHSAEMHLRSDDKSGIESAYEANTDYFQRNVRIL